MSRFNTLLQREWMQNHRGWLVLVLALPVLLLAITPFSSVQFDSGDAQVLQSSGGLMLMAMVFVPVAVLTLTVVALAIQASGLARRDLQDRSIEFWLSLPTSHAASIGATVLAHFVLLPLAAVAVGAGMGYLIGVALIGKLLGFGAVAALPWSALWLAGGAGLARGLFGVVLASAWLMPLILLTMAASAWMKRWGVAVLTIVLTFAHLLLVYRYRISVVGDTLHGLLANAPVAVLHTLSTGRPPQLPAVDDLGAWLHAAPGWLLHDAMASLQELGQPLFLVAIAGSVAGYALLVLRRSRTG